MIFLIMQKIKNKIYSFFNSLHLFSYIILLLFLCSISVYIQYFRPRLPKDIPYSLDDFYFYILLGICLSYMYIIYRSIYPKNPPQFIVDLAKKIANPFINLHSKIIYHPKIYSIYYDILYKKIIPKFFFLSYNRKKNVYFVVKFLPRILLLSIFILDIFLFQKIKIFYYFLPINIILLLFLYFIITLKNSKEFLIQKLESCYSYILIEEENNNIPKVLWEDIIDNFGRKKYNELSFSEKIEILIYDNNNHHFPSKGLVKHNPNAIHHGTDVSIREALEILYERFCNYDEDDIENSYEYIFRPRCYDHIYRKYEQIYNLEKFELNTYKILHHEEKIAQEFDEIKNILLRLFFFLDTLEHL